jgi:hypothetical protein
LVNVFSNIKLLFRCSFTLATKWHQNYFNMFFSFWKIKFQSGTLVWKKVF